MVAGFMEITDRKNRRLPTPATISVRAKARHALPPLAFRSDESAQNQRESQANCKVMPKHFPAPFILFGAYRGTPEPRLRPEAKR
jgi:hypothetical protein